MLWWRVSGGKAAVAIFELSAGMVHVSVIGLMVGCIGDRECTQSNTMRVFFFVTPKPVALYIHFMWCAWRRGIKNALQINMLRVHHIAQNGFMWCSLCS